MIRSLSALSICFAVACGGGDGEKPAVDAPAAIDGPAGTVMSVTCPGAADASITTDGFAFSPNAATISANGIVKFTLPANHNVVPDSAAGMTDPGLTVGFGATACLKFTAAGTYHFKCLPHSFTGTITVQ